jgi:hypothetical protein
LACDLEDTFGISEILNASYVSSVTEVQYELRGFLSQECICIRDVGRIWVEYVNNKYWVNLSLLKDGT